MKKKITLDEIKKFVEVHIDMKSMEELGDIMARPNIEAYKDGLEEGIINGILSFCNQEIEGIDIVNLPGSETD